MDADNFRPHAVDESSLPQLSALVRRKGCHHGHIDLGRLSKSSRVEYTLIDHDHQVLIKGIDSVLQDHAAFLIREIMLR